MSNASRDIIRHFSAVAREEPVELLKQKYYRRSTFKNMVKWISKTVFSHNNASYDRRKVVEHDLYKEHENLY